MDILNHETWKKQFGVLPIKLNPLLTEDRFLMLNGGYSDFCLQSFEDSDDVIDSIAWSSNVKNYLKIINNQIYLRNWFENKTEVFSQESVIHNFEKLHSYISYKSYKTESDISPFILQIFNQLRNLTQEKSNPIEALNLLFLLLISINEDHSNIDTSLWGIQSVTIPRMFDFFVEKIRNGVKTAKPDLDLILRHSSGKIFQEANRNVVSFNSQLDIFGGISDKITTATSAYSSIHYTPQYIARSIVENCLNNLNLEELSDISILDPSCGSSEFLVEVLKQLRNKNYSGNINIKGFDSSINAIETSKFLLNYENRTQWNNNLNITINCVDDSLNENWGTNNIVIMNPPFTSFELIKDKITKDTIKSTLNDYIKEGRPNQASAFLLKAINSLSDNSVFGCVLPSSLFTLDIYKTLREYISERINIKIIGKLGNYVFEDALTDVSIIVGIKSETKLLPKLIWTKNEKGIAQNAISELRKLQANNEISISKETYSIYSPDKFPIIDNTWRIISQPENKFISDLKIYTQANSLCKLQDVFTVYQGALLGVKNIFVISQEEFSSYNPLDQQYFRPLINNNAIKNGKINISQYVWYPYNENGIMINTEDELYNIHFANTVLRPQKMILEKRSEDRNKWWALTRPRNWQFKTTKRLYSARFGNSSSFGYDIDGSAVISEGNAFFPKKEMEENDLLFYLAIFSSDYFDNLLSIFSRQLAGGKWYDLGNNFLKHIPIPNAHIPEIKQSDSYNKLVEIGHELIIGNQYVKKLSKNQMINFYPKIIND